MALQDFKDINEKTMANMLLHLSINCSGQDDLNSRIVFNLFEANKTGDSAPIQKDPNFKNTQMQWHVAHFSRAFRENYSNLNWTRVLDAFTELPDDSNVNSLAQQFDQKSYSFFLQLFTKSKPQNLQVSISLLVEQHWKNPSLQLRFLHNSMQAYISNEDKTTFNYSKCARRIGSI
jgi:sulfur relay (sulfurtransferase) DsrC/TusE family protein